MILTICGSMAFAKQFKSLAEELEKFGHIVYYPESDMEFSNGDKCITTSVSRDGVLSKETDEISREKKQIFDQHIEFIKKSDAVLVANYTKNNIEGYIGVSTLIEASIAHYLHKGIYLFNPIPNIGYCDEIYRLMPIIINGDIGSIPVE